MRVVGASVVLAVLLTACSGPTTVTVVASPSGTATVVSPTLSESPPLTARQVAVALKQRGLPISGVVVYTASSDPNDLLGRPNGYTSKVAFTDSRVDDSDTTYLSKGDVGFGGSVEVFKDAASAKARAKYLQAVHRASPILGSEYDFLSGAILVRVTGNLTPAQADTYKRTLRRVTGEPVAAV